MKRAIRKFVGTLTGPKKYIFYVSLILICVVAICLGIYAQFFYRYADTDALMLGNIGSEKTAEEIEILKTNFNSLFENKINGEPNIDSLDIEKAKNEMDIVFSNFKLNVKDETYYSVEAIIPTINIQSDVVKEMNAEIKEEFYTKANNIVRRTEGHTVYNVSWVAYINGDILSLAVKASLSEEGKPERVYVKTYNYDIKGDKKVNITDLIEKKKTTANKVQSTIDSEIKTAYTNAKIIAVEYGSLYERDLSSDMYKLENTENFLLTQDGNIYIIYAYGNKDYTNEMDIIIF